MSRKVLAPKVGVKGAKRRAKAFRGIRLPVSLPKGSLFKKGPPRGKKQVRASILKEWLAFT